MGAERVSLTQTQYATNEIKQIVKIVLEIGEKPFEDNALKRIDYVDFPYLRKSVYGPLHESSPRRNRNYPQYTRKV